MSICLQLNTIKGPGVWGLTEDEGIKWGTSFLFDRSLSYAKVDVAILMAVYGG